MSRTYKATGINLKAMPLGESDRLLTILTREFGLIRAIAPGARKHHSKLGGRSGLFVVNHLLIAPGRTLDKITQAETLTSYPKLSQDLSKLTASQYLAELVLCQALSEQPQDDLFCLLSEHLSRLEQHSLVASVASASPVRLLQSQSDAPDTWPILARLAQAVFHLLALAGLAPQVQACCFTQRPLVPDFSQPRWQVGFSVMAGGAIDLTTPTSLSFSVRPKLKPRRSADSSLFSRSQPETESEPSRNAIELQPNRPPITLRLTALELTLLQQLSQPDLSHLAAAIPVPVPLSAWQTVERALRHYAESQYDRPIRSAGLIETCCLPVAPVESAYHDAIV